MKSMKWSLQHNGADVGGEGIQLGLVNIMPDGRYPVMPIFNIGF